MATETKATQSIGDHPAEGEGSSDVSNDEPKKRGLAVRSLHADNRSYEHERAVKGELPKHKHIVGGKENVYRSPYPSKKQNKDKIVAKKESTKFVQTTTKTPRSKKKRVIDQKPTRTPVRKGGTTRIKVGKEPYSSPLQIGIHTLAEDKSKQETQVQSFSILSPKSKQSRSHMVIKTPPRRVPIYEQHGTRLIKSGPIRVPVRRTPPKPPQSQACPRVGFDGTSQTPSKELLRSTASSLRKQVPAHIGFSEETRKIESHSPTRNHRDRTQLKVLSPGARSKNITFKPIMAPVHPRRNLSPRRTNANGGKGPSISPLSPPIPGCQDETYLSVGGELKPSLYLSETDIVGDMDSLAINTDNGNDASVDSSIVHAMEDQHPGTPSMDELDEERHACEDPVAITLLNNGEEQFGLLLDRDIVPARTAIGTSIETTVFVPPASPRILERGEGAERTDPDGREMPSLPSLQGGESEASNVEAVDERDSHSAVALDAVTNSSPIQYEPLRKVSNSLLDVLGDEEVASLRRPVAVVGRPKSPDESENESDAPSLTP